MRHCSICETPPRLLIVDKPEICYTLQYILQYYGYATRAATDGAEALRLLLHERFDLLLIEPRLPGHVEGRRLIQLAETHQPGAAIVLLTGALDLAPSSDASLMRSYPTIDKAASPTAIVSGVTQALAQFAMPPQDYSLPANRAVR